MANLSRSKPIVTIRTKVVDIDAVRRRLEALGRLCLRGATHPDPREVLSTMRLIEMEGRS